MGAEARRPRVAVTRAAGQADELARRLEAMGCEPVVWPLIAVEPLDGGPLDPSPYDWVVVTSPNGAADDPATREQVEAERTVIAVVGGGCLAAAAAHHDGVTLAGLVAAEDGSWLEKRTGADAQALGEELAAIAAAHAAP